MKPKITAFSKGISLFITGFLTLLILFQATVRLMGLTPYAVLSGSMEPTFPVGSLIYVKDTDPNTLLPGDPITFSLSPTTVATHRIVSIEEEDGLRYFRTRGDANPAPDGSPVDSRNVLGTPLFCVPILGYVSVFLRSLPGMLLLGLLALSLLAAAILPAIRLRADPAP